LLTHHQAFSAYDPVIGSKTLFGTHSPQIDYTLMQQLFDVGPKVSVWFWGHEHRLGIYKSYSYGFPCCRMVGNSAFQVHQDNTYTIKYPSNNIVMSTYNPKRSDTQDPNMRYFDHTGCVLSLEQAGVNIKYVNMTSSYLNKSVFTGEFNEVVSQPVHK
jgi:hypothetical protein